MMPGLPLVYDAATPGLVGSRRASRRRLLRQLLQKPTVALGVIAMLAWTVISILAHRPRHGPTRDGRATPWILTRCVLTEITVEFSPWHESPGIQLAPFTV
jgi:hypothetical protein